MNKFSFPFLFIALLLSACSSPPSERDPIAKVNGKNITVRNYLNLFENLKPKDVSLKGVERAKIKNLAIQTLVRRTVILTTAKAKHISVSDKELEEGVEKYKSGYSDQMFKETLLKGMVDEKEWKEQVKENLLMEKLVKESGPKIQAPTLEEALNYYEGNSHQFNRPAEVTALQIVVSDKKLAENIHHQLVDKKEPFLDLAKKYSIGPEATSDDSIDVQKEIMPESVDKVLFSIPIKKISPVVKSPYGYHIFKVISRKPSMNLDFRQVKQQIFAQLYENRRQKWIEEFEDSLIRSAKIEYNRELIKKL